MKHESILQVLHENFILYGWDLTHETNKHLYVYKILIYNNNFVCIFSQLLFFIFFIYMECHCSRLLSSVTACISNTASLTVRNISIDKLPSILIIGRSRVSGRTSCEVLSVIHGKMIK